MEEVVVSNSAAGHDIIVVGASAGGVETLQRLVKMLPGDLPASIFIVMHLSSQGPSLLASILEKAGSLPALTALDGMPIEHGRIYVAPPNRHMLLEGDRLHVIHGPKENRHRPAIDPLFRSAAWAYGPRVVAVVLSGTLDDGTAGLWAVKSCGGIAVVQDPSEALHSGMPTSALLSMNVDYCLPLEKIGVLLKELALQPVNGDAGATPPGKIAVETEFTKMHKDIHDMNALGKLSPFTCPTCQGALWELADDDLLRYRCHTGHAFSPDSLLAEQSETVEKALYSALRALEEKAAIARRLAERFGERMPNLAAKYQKEALGLDEEVAILRHLLATGAA